MDFSCISERISMCHLKLDIQIRENPKSEMCKNGLNVLLEVGSDMGISLHARVGDPRSDNAGLEKAIGLLLVIENLGLVGKDTWPDRHSQISGYF